MESVAKKMFANPSLIAFLCLAVFTKVCIGRYGTCENEEKIDQVLSELDELKRTVAENSKFMKDNRGYLKGNVSLRKFFRYSEMHFSCTKHDYQKLYFTWKPMK